MKIILLRHEESTSNKSNKADSQIDAGLTDKGKTKSRELIKKIKKLNVDVFIVSPLKRTLQTINPYLNLNKNNEVIPDKLTLERDLEKFTGTPMGTFQKYCKDNNLNKIFHTPERGESIETTYKRAKRFLSELIKKYPLKNLLICGHKNFLMCLEIAIRKKSINNFSKFKSLKTGQLRKFNI